MDRAAILERLLSWTLEHGFAHHALADLARPLGLTRGGLGHYFDAADGGIKADLGRELLAHARGVRARFLLHPTEALRGGPAQKRRFFAGQMALYLRSAYGGRRAASWSCPAFLLHLELARMLGRDEPDARYQRLLADLFAGRPGPGGLRPGPAQLERLVSGPYAPREDAVLGFFAVAPERRTEAPAARPGT